MRPHQTLKTLLLSSGLLLASTAAMGETLEMPEGVQHPTEEREMIAMEMPAKGMSKAQVLEQFGEPLEKIMGVGEPPISRWLYEDYTVYFEYQYVLHSVLNR